MRSGIRHRFAYVVTEASEATSSVKVPNKQLNLDIE